MGQPGLTVVIATGGVPVATGNLVTDLAIEGVGFSEGVGAPRDHGGIVELQSCLYVQFHNCSFIVGGANGLALDDSMATLADCVFSELKQAAVYSMDGRGLLIRGNRIDQCGNAGVRLFRSAPGRDGSIVSGNIISKVDFTDGGNGQNGNGISIYLADDVIVSDNQISDCAFSAVRINGGKNCQIRGNSCSSLGETAIYAEFGFSGSVIADNVVDGAATGISITNLDQGGHLATCTGNIVRNITASSANNPDVKPVGIYAEADTVIANNAIDSVPGIGIAVGYGPYVRNVVVSDNVVSGAVTGIGVSVVQQQSPGPVRIEGNIISGAAQPMVGTEWEKVVSNDLAADAASYPNIIVGSNTIS